VLCLKHLIGVLLAWLLNFISVTDKSVSVIDIVWIRLSWAPFCCISGNLIYWSTNKTNTFIWGLAVCQDTVMALLLLIQLLLLLLLLLLILLLLLLHNYSDHYYIVGWPYLCIYIYSLLLLSTQNQNVVCSKNVHLKFLSTEILTCKLFFLLNVLRRTMRSILFHICTEQVEWLALLLHIQNIPSFFLDPISWGFSCFPLLLHTNAGIVP
jgi:hypothetical protein